MSEFGLSSSEGSSSERLPDFELMNPTRTGVGCNSCFSELDKNKVRSKCMVCPDYDLCENCIRSQEHDHEHTAFWKITAASPRVTSNRTPWMSASVGTIPKGSLVAGKSGPNGYDVIVARGTSSNDLLPGYILPTEGCCLVVWDGLLDGPQSYETLILDPEEVDWVRGTDGNFKPWAIAGGITTDNEVLFIGRVKHEGETLVGKIQPSLKSLVVPFRGDYIKFKKYEVLVLKTK